MIMTDAIPSVIELESFLDEIKKELPHFSEEERTLLKEDLNSFMKRDFKLSEEAIACLFTGWWVRSNAISNFQKN